MANFTFAPKTSRGVPDFSRPFAPAPRVGEAKPPAPFERGMIVTLVTVS